MLAEFKKELPGILNWIIQGYKSYKENGLIVPEIVHNSTQEYRKETDSLGTFIEENCVSGTKFNCSLKVFTKAYIDWCEENNEYPNIFGNLLEKNKDEKQNNNKKYRLHSKNISLSKKSILNNNFNF